MKGRLALLALLIGGPTASPPALEQAYDRVPFGHTRGAWTGAAAAEKGGGFVVAGYAAAVDGPAECRVRRYDDDGRSTWQKSFTTEPKKADVCSFARPAAEGFLVGGYATSRATKRDAWVIGLEADGRRAFQVIHGGPGQEDVNDAILHRGRVVAVGSTTSSGAGNADGLVLHIDPQGGVLRQHEFGGPGFDFFDAVDVSDDGTLLLAGRSPPNGDVRARPDAWVVRMRGDGTVAWEKRFGTMTRDGAVAIFAEPEGRSLVVGTVGRVDKDLRPIRPREHTPRADPTEAWIARLDGNGVVEKEVRVGDFARLAMGAVRHGDELIVVGAVTDPKGYYDTWIAAYDRHLSRRWHHRAGGKAHDHPAAVARLANGTLVTAGWFAKHGSFHVKPWIAGWKRP